MKNVILLLSIVLIFVGCSDDEGDNTVELLGEWALVEIYADPGDGSGDFVPVESELRIQFNSDDSVNSNGNLCFFSANLVEPGNYVYDYETETNTINGLNCSVTFEPLSFEIENNRLFVSYPCIEPCVMKFSKVG